MIPETPLASQPEDAGGVFLGHMGRWGPLSLLQGRGLHLGEGGLTGADAGFLLVTPERCLDALQLAPQILDPQEPAAALPVIYFNRLRSALHAFCL